MLRQRGNLRLKRENLWAPWRINYIQGLVDNKEVSRTEEPAQVTEYRMLPHVTIFSIYDHQAG